MLVVSFESTHHAIFAEKMFEKADLTMMTIPTPREVDKSCGISIKIEEKDMQEAVRIVERYRIGLKGIYKVTSGAKAKKIYPND